MKSIVERRLEVLYTTYEEGVAALAEEVREKYLIPFCDKHGLLFSSAMGAWSFWARESPADAFYTLQLSKAFESYGSAYRELGYLHSGYGTKRYHCKRLLALLNLVPDGNRCLDLGDWIDSYTPPKKS